jgi:glutamate synthase (NADPH/NADH) small chain
MISHSSVGTALAPSFVSTVFSWEPIGTTKSPKPPKKKLDLNRREMPKQPHDIRRYNFDEVALGYSAETAMEEAVRCLQCPSANCVNRCPVESDIPAFVEHIARGNFGEGVRILKEKNCLPAICGRVCPQVGS